MTRKLSTPQLGFFGLNGAKILLGTILFIILYFIIREIPGFTLLNDISYSDIKNIPTPILTLILALFFAGASLVGIIVGEIVDYIIVLYWRGVCQARLNDFEDHIMKYINQGDEGGRVYGDELRAHINHVFLDGDAWEGYYLLPYRQEFLTRFILILTLFSTGFLLLLLSFNFSLLNLTEEHVSRLTHINFLILLILILAAISLLFFSLRIKIEPNWSKAARKLLLDSIPLFFMILIYLVIWWLKEFAPKSMSVELFDLWFILVMWLFYVLEFSLLMVLLHLGVVSQILKARKAKSIKNKELFGTIVENNDQWYNLIISYYELFFYRRKEEGEEGSGELSKPESYLLTISGAYIYRAIQPFSPDTSERRDGATGSKDDFSDSKKYLDSLNNTIDLVYGELERGNFERAKQIYSALDEQILIYFANLPKDEEEVNIGDENESTTKDTPNLRYEAIPLYLIKSSRVVQLIEKAINGNTLDKILGKLKTLKRESIKFDFYVILEAIVNNQYTTENTLRTMVDDKEYSNELDSDILFSIVGHPNISNNVLFSIVGHPKARYNVLEEMLEKNKNAEIIDPDILHAIIVNKDEELNYKILSLLLAPEYREINFNILSTIANHSSATPDILLRILKQSMEDKILLAVANNQIATPAILLRILKQSTDNEILLTIVSHVNVTPEILESTLPTLDSSNLASDILRDILIAIADNSNTASNILSKILTEEKYLKIRDTNLFVSIARHPNTTSDILNEILAQRVNEDVLGVIAKSSKVSLKILEEILTKEDYSETINPDVLEAIVDNEIANTNIFNIVLTHHDSKITENVLTAIVENPRTSKEVLLKILTEPKYSQKITFKAINTIGKHPNTNSTVQEEIDRFLEQKGGNST